MPSLESRSRAVRRRRLAAQHLRMLLIEREPYRARWFFVAGATPPSVIRQAAVARVIAAHLRDVQGEAGKLDYRPLKDRVYKALTGRALSPETLELFAAAFRFTGEDAQQLRSILAGAAPDAALPWIPAAAVLCLSAEEVVWLRETLGALGGEDIAEAILARL